MLNTGYVLEKLKIQYNAIIHQSAEAIKTGIRGAEGSFDLKNKL